MVLVILLVLALFVIQTLLPGRFREPPRPGDASGLKENLGPRDHVRPFTVVGARAARALANLQEALPVFLALALLNVILTPAPLAVAGAWLFLIARLFYVALYMAGVPIVRTLVWAAGWAGLIMMLIPVLARAT